MRTITSYCDICKKEKKVLHEISIYINGARQLSMDFCDEHLNGITKEMDNFWQRIKQEK